MRIKLPVEIPSLRMLLIWGNLAGHATPEPVFWPFSQKIIPLYTPLGGPWLNMTESVPRILKQRALGEQPPQTADDIIT